MSDLGLISSFKIHNVDEKSVRSICELDDGSFVSTAFWDMKRWDGTGTVLQIFYGHLLNYINRVMELKRDIIVSASSDRTVKMWRVSTGECLRTLTLHSGRVTGLEKVMDGLFVSGCLDGKTAVWDDEGNSIETHQSGWSAGVMTSLRDGSIVTADKDLIVIRRL